MSSPTQNTNKSTMMASSWPMAGSEFLAGLRTISLRELPEDERTCTLCNIPYDAITEKAQEAPIQLPCCSHIFGDWCAYYHMAEQHENNNTCPTCGAVAYIKLHQYTTDADDVNSEDYDDLARTSTPTASTSPQLDPASPPSPAPSPTESELNAALEHEERLALEYEESQRFEVAFNRRNGSLIDRLIYAELLTAGANFPPLAPRDLLLTVEQDKAFFEGLSRSGAFAREGVLEGMGERSDGEVYEIMRDAGLGWDLGAGKWVANGVR